MIGRGGVERLNRRTSTVVKPARSNIETVPRHSDAADEHPALPGPQPIEQVAP